jgi:acetyl-CoA acetyltransferase
VRDVAIVSYNQFATRREQERNEIEYMLPVVKQTLAPLGLTTQDIGFTVSGSTDYLAGQAFAFVSALDAIGPWPPIAESHVEMDGAFALYEAWVRLQHGDIDTALVYAFGKSSPGDVGRVLSLQLEPYTVAPQWPDAASLAALQARALLDSGKVSEKDLARVVARSRRAALDNPHAQLKGEYDEAALLDEPLYNDPLRKHDLPPITDGAVAVVIARADKARELCDNPVFITGFAHCSELHYPGMRDLTSSPSTTIAAKAAALEEAPVEVAELQSAFTHEEPLLVEALGLGSDVAVNPSGGPLSANPIMATGLVRICEAAEAIRSGGKQRTLAHSTSGPCLQQNLVCILEGDAK